jgi:predicted permease
LTNLKNGPIGFNPERVLLFALDPPALRYPNERAESLFAQLRDRFAAIPGVEWTTYSALPLVTARASLSNASVTLPGREPVWNAASIAHHHEIGRDFFETMGISMQRGRSVDDRPDAGAVRSVVVNQAFGAHFFPEEDPIGKTFFDHTGTTYGIVGVCADARDEGLRYRAQRAFFTRFQSQRRASVTFELKIGGDAAGIIEQVRQILGSVDADLYVTDVRTQTEQIHATLSQERLLAVLATIFGSLALLLACIGIYGVTAYAVARRTGEIGIRVALGAEPAGVQRMILRETLLLTAAGVAIGIPAVLAVSGYSQSFLYGLTPNDPATIAAAVLVLALVGSAAGYFPARRAARIDPMTALRHD